MGDIYSFRPHEGDPSSLLRKELLASGKLSVSVPTKGTHLLYEKRNCVWSERMGFRPHEGDPSSLHILPVIEFNSSVSVPTKGTHLLY